MLMQTRQERRQTQTIFVIAFYFNSELSITSMKYLRVIFMNLILIQRY